MEVHIFQPSVAGWILQSDTEHDEALFGDASSFINFESLDLQTMLSPLSLHENGKVTEESVGDAIIKLRRG
jgi:hypothetical protein